MNDNGEVTVAGLQEDRKAKRPDDGKSAVNSVTLSCLIFSFERTLLVFEVNSKILDWASPEKPDWAKTCGEAPTSTRPRYTDIVVAM